MTHVVHKGSRLGEVVGHGEGGGAVLVRFTNVVLEEKDVDGIPTGYHHAVTEEQWLNVHEIEEVVTIEAREGVTTVTLADGTIIMLGTTVVPGTGGSDVADDVGEAVPSDGLDERERPARSAVRARTVRRNR